MDDDALTEVAELLFLQYDAEEASNDSGNGDYSSDVES